MSEHAQTIQAPAVFTNGRHSWQLLLDAQGRLCFQALVNGQWATRVRCNPNGDVEAAGAFVPGVTF